VSGPPRATPGRELPSAFAALRHRNFRLLWSGQLVSMAGTIMQSAAILWHVSLLVQPQHRGVALGMVGLVRVVPIVVFSLVSGVVADAHDRRALMLVTQTGMALCAAGLAALEFAGVRLLWPVYALAAVSAAFGTFDGPARQSLTATLVPREELPNAISLMTIMFQVASVAGPAVGGLVIATRGVAWCYAANALSFLCVIAAVLAMRDLPRAPAAERAQVSWAAAREGLSFVFRTPLIRSTMLLDFFATFFASATALLPMVATDLLRVGARGYGLLSAAPSVGAVLAGLVMAPLANRIRRRGAVLLWAVAAYGVATVGFGLARDYAAAFACLALTGAADTVSMVIRNVIRQLSTPDTMRGRMTSVNMIFFMGGPQLGELEAGLLAQAAGVAASVVSGGLGCLLAVAWVAGRTPALRRYVREPAASGGAGA
jgi:MFS family permease